MSEVSVTAEFKMMMERAWNAIDKGLLDAGEDAKDVLRQSIYDNVYSYNASPWAMYKRRYDDGGLGDKANMFASVIDVGKSGRFHELQIEDFAGFQGTPVEDKLARVIEDGDPAYRQPGPRPFYRNAEKQLVDGGIVVGEIVGALLDAGFELI